MWYQKRTGRATKTDELSEKFQTAFDRLPHFRKIMFQFFSRKTSEKKMWHFWQIPRLTGVAETLYTQFIDHLWHMLGRVNCKSTCCGVRICTTHGGGNFFYVRTECDPYKERNYLPAMLIKQIMIFSIPYWITRILILTKIQWFNVRRNYKSYGCIFPPLS